MPKEKMPTEEVPRANPLPEKSILLGGHKLSKPVEVRPQLEQTETIEPTALTREQEINYLQQNIEFIKVAQAARELRERAKNQALTLAEEKLLTGLKRRYTVLQNKISKIDWEMPAANHEYVAGTHELNWFTDKLRALGIEPEAEIKPIKIPQDLTGSNQPIEEKDSLSGQPVVEESKPITPEVVPAEPEPVPPQSEPERAAPRVAANPEPTPPPRPTAAPWSSGETGSVNVPPRTARTETPPGPRPRWNEPEGAAAVWGRRFGLFVRDRYPDYKEKAKKVWGPLKERLHGLATFGYWDLQAAEKFRKETGRVDEAMQETASKEIQPTTNLNYEAAYDEAGLMKNMAYDNHGNFVGDLTRDEYEMASQRLTMKKERENAYHVNAIIEQAKADLRRRVSEYRLARNNQMALSEEKLNAMAVALRAELNKLSDGVIKAQGPSFAKVVRESIDKNWKERYWYAGIEAALAATGAVKLAQAWYSFFTPQVISLP